MNQDTSPTARGKPKFKDIHAGAPGIPSIGN